MLIGILDSTQRLIYADKLEARKLSKRKCKIGKYSRITTNVNTGGDRLEKNERLSKCTDRCALFQNRGT